MAARLTNDSAERLLARYCANLLRENGNNGTDEGVRGKASLSKSGHSSVNPSASPTCPEKSRSSHLNFLSVPLFPFAPHSLSLLPKFQQFRGRKGLRSQPSRKRIHKAARRERSVLRSDPARRCIFIRLNDLLCPSVDVTAKTPRQPGRQIQE